MARGSKIYPSFVKFLKSKDPSDGSEEALITELTELNAELEKNVSISTCLGYPFYFVDADNIMRFCRRGEAYLAQCGGW